MPQCTTREDSRENTELGIVRDSRHMSADIFSLPCPISDNGFPQRFVPDHRSGTCRGPRDQSFTLQTNRSLGCGDVAGRFIVRVLLDRSGGSEVISIFTQSVVPFERVRAFVGGADRRTEVASDVEVSVAENRPGTVLSVTCPHGQQADAAWSYAAPPAVPRIDQGIVKSKDVVYGVVV